eukprot:COSAG01_NODE_231_length_21019_cov_104.980501_8_plen_174_part_00
MFTQRNIGDLVTRDGKFHPCGRSIRGGEKQHSVTLLALAQKRVRSSRGDVTPNPLPWGLRNADKLRLQRCAYKHCRHCVDGKPPVVFSLTHRGAARTPKALLAARERWDRFQRALGETGEEQQCEGPCLLLCEGCDADRTSGQLHAGNGTANERRLTAAMTTAAGQSTKSAVH